MGLLERARADVRQITTNLNDWSSEMTLIKDNVEYAIKGLHTKRRTTVDTEGVDINAKHAHISFSEQELVDAGCTVRNANDEVDLKDVVVKVADSTGEVKNYQIREWFPDETLGLIVCILGDYDLEASEQIFDFTFDFTFE